MKIWPHCYRLDVVLGNRSIPLYFVPESATGFVQLRATCILRRRFNLSFFLSLSHFLPFYLGTFISLSSFSIICSVVSYSARTRIFRTKIILTARFNVRVSNVSGVLTSGYINSLPGREGQGRAGKGILRSLTCTRDKVTLLINIIV